jgi:hypothetical protein
MSRTRKIILSGFILFNFLPMLRIHLPLDAKFIGATYRPVDAYLSFFSIYQDWMMFAKNPARLNIYLTADVEFDDGTRDTYVFPKPTELSLLEKYIYGERFRKIISESIRRDDNRFMWPDTAKFALRKLRDRNFAKLPLRVHLNRHWYVTPAMEQEFLPHLQRKANYEKFKFYTYEVI